MQQRSRKKTERAEEKRKKEKKHQKETNKTWQRTSLDVPIFLFDAIRAEELLQFLFGYMQTFIVICVFQCQLRNY